MPELDKAKKRVLNAWVLFFQNGFQKKHFAKVLYEHLVQHCEFIAHYDRAGFYDSYFTDPEMTMKFVGQFDRANGCKSVEYGMTWWIEGTEKGGRSESWKNYDINNAMVDAITPMLSAIRRYLKTQALRLAKVALEKATVRVQELERSANAQT